MVAPYLEPAISTVSTTTVAPGLPDGVATGHLHENFAVEHALTTDRKGVFNGPLAAWADFGL